MPVSEARKKTFAWTDLVTAVIVDGVGTAPVTRMRTMWVAAPAMIQTGLFKALTRVTPLTYSSVAAVAVQGGYAKLWIPALVLSTISLLKKTKTFAKLVEPPMKVVQKALQPKEEGQESKAVSFLKKVAAPTLGAAIQMLVEYPFQVVMYRMASDTRSTTLRECFLRSLGVADGVGIAGLKTLYMGYDVTVYGVLVGAVAMSTAETSGIRVLAMPSQLVAGVVSLMTDGLALRMVCSQTWSPMTAMEAARQNEGLFWVVRGLPLLLVENIVPVFLDGLRGKVVSAVFSDVVTEAQNAQQQHMDHIMAQFQAMQAAEKTAQQQAGQPAAGQQPVQVEELPEESS